MLLNKLATKSQMCIHRIVRQIPDTRIPFGVLSFMPECAPASAVRDFLQYRFRNFLGLAWAFFVPPWIRSAYVPESQHLEIVLGCLSSALNGHQSDVRLHTPGVHSALEARFGNFGKAPNALKRLVSHCGPQIAQNAPNSSSKADRGALGPLKALLSFA